MPVLKMLRMSYGRDRCSVMIKLCSPTAIVSCERETPNITGEMLGRMTLKVSSENCELIYHSQANPNSYPSTPNWWTRVNMYGSRGKFSNDDSSNRYRNSGMIAERILHGAANDIHTNTR